MVRALRGSNEDVQAPAWHKFARINIVDRFAEMLRIEMIRLVRGDRDWPVIDGDQVQINAHRFTRGQQSGAGASGPTEKVRSENGLSHAGTSAASSALSTRSNRLGTLASRSA